MWSPRERKSDPAEVTRELRANALTVAASDVGIAPDARGASVWGVLMETGYPEAHLAHFTPAAGTPLPDVGRVRFYVRTHHGTLTAEADEEDLGYGRHVLSPVFHAGHGVISAIRERVEPEEE